MYDGSQGIAVGFFICPIIIIMTNEKQSGIRCIDLSRVRFCGKVKAYDAK